MERVLPCNMRSPSLPSRSPSRSLPFDDGAITAISPDPPTRSLPSVGTERIHFETPEEEEAREANNVSERLRLRMGRCGGYYTAMNGGNGSSYTWQYRCGRWREGCPPCLEIRTRKFAQRAECIRSILGANLRIRQLSASDSKALRRKIPANGYWRIPTKEGEILLWDAAILDEPGNLSYDDLLWEDLCKTPGRKRVSGTLGLPGRSGDDSDNPDDDSDNPDDDNPGDPESICPKLPHVMATLPKGTPYTLSQLWDCAAYKTHTLAPSFDRNEVEDACTKRMEAYTSLVVQHGGWVVHSIKRKTRLPYYRYSGWTIPIKPQEYDQIVRTTSTKARPAPVVATPVA